MAEGHASPNYWLIWLYLSILTVIEIATTCHHKFRPVTIERAFAIRPLKIPLIIV